MEEVAKPKYVWWDLDCLQVPRGRDPYEVRWIIESALNKKFGAGPVTIFAIGNLNRIPGRVLELLISRAGVVIKNTTLGGKSITDDLLSWTDDHPPPAILMVISDREYHYEDLAILEADGYTIIRTYVNQKPDSPSYASDAWLWKTLLTTDTTTMQQELQGKCCETGGWDCILCLVGGQSFTDFITHCKTRLHLRLESYTVVDRDRSVHGPTDPFVPLDSLPTDPFVPLDSLEQKSHTEPEPRQGPMLKFLLESCNGIGSVIAAIKQRDCSVVRSDKGLASLHAQPKKHKKQHKGGEHKLKESRWAAGPSEEVLASLNLSNLYRDCDDKF